MKRHFYLLLTLLLLFSCSKTNLKEMCDVENPITELKWLSNEIESFNTDSQLIIVSKVIVKHKETKKKQKLFQIRKGQISTLNDCSGNVIESTGGIIYIESKYEVLKSEELYRN